MITYDTAERPSAAEYVAFLSRTELGSMYPRKAFRARIESLLENVDICVTARTSDRTLVGVCLGLTDFAYFLYLTDLGVDRDHLRRGIGRRLVRLAHDAAGGPADICAVTWANRAALPFYAACGYERIDHAVGKHATDWDLFRVESRP